MICGNFTVSRPMFGSVLELLPPVLLLKPTADGDWLEAILRRMVSESALERPGQGVALSRLTEVLFVEVLRSWIKSLSPGQGGWLGAISDPHIGPALKLIHEKPERPWTLSDLGQRVGLGRSAFSARFTRLVGQPMHRYVIERRMAEAAFLLETSDEGIARIASRVGYETAAAFSKLFHRYHGLSPGRYRAARRSDGGRKARGRSGSRSRRLTLRSAPARSLWHESCQISEGGGGAAADWSNMKVATDISNWGMTGSGPKRGASRRRHVHSGQVDLREFKDLLEAADGKMDDIMSHHGVRHRSR